MSNRSVIVFVDNKHQNIASIGSRWGADTYGLAEQIEQIASSMGSVDIDKHKDPVGFIKAVVKHTVKNNKDFVYEIPEENLHAQVANCNWDMELNILQDNFDAFSILDYMDKSELDEYDLKKLGDFDLLTPFLKLTWDECKNLTGRFDELKMNGCVYFQDKNELDSVYYLSQL